MSNKKSAARATGDLDLTFGLNGLVELPNPSSSGIRVFVVALAVDPATEVGQRIYVGLAEGPSRTINGYVARLLADGQIDTSFGKNGYVLLPAGNAEEQEAIYLEHFVFDDAAGTITCFGRVLYRPLATFYPAAVRITFDGVVDQSFGEYGLAVYRTPPVADQPPRKGFVRPTRDESIAALLSPQGGGGFGTSGNARLVDGKILFLAADYLFARVGHLARINLDGSLDSSFGSQGLILVTDPWPSESPVQVWGFDVDRSGGIVVVGWGRVNGHGVVCRYDSQGNRDQAFGDVGVVRFPAGGGYTAFIPRTVKALDDGRLILQIAAAPDGSGNPPPQFPAVVKLLRNGERDPSFNQGEPVTVDLRPSLYVVDRMTLDAATRILIVGDRVGNGLPVAGCISRFEPAGMPDQGFGVEGTRVYEEFQAGFRSIAIQDRINILILISGNEFNHIARFIG